MEATVPMMVVIIGGVVAFFILLLVLLVVWIIKSKHRRIVPLACNLCVCTLNIKPSCVDTN